jgi:hypothetical protein
MGRPEDIFERLKVQGESAIDELIITRQAEELYLDFKRSTDLGGGSKLHDTDRANFAKAISGFGNSEGGVIVWGVDASKDLDGADVARAKVPLRNATRFASWLQGLVSGCTLPPHQEVHTVPLSNHNGEGFAASLIKRSNHAPHQSVVDYKYYLRAGSSFYPATHSFIAGMFGRRPQPRLIHNFGIYAASRTPSLKGADGEEIGHGISLALEILISNKSPAIAKDVFVSAKLVAPGPNCQRWFENPSDGWIKHKTVLDQTVSVIAQDGVKVAPETIVCPLIARVVLIPPFTQGLWITANYGCEGAPVGSFEIQNDALKVADIYRDFIGSSVESSSRVTRLAFNLDENESITIGTSKTA